MFSRIFVFDLLFELFNICYFMNFKKSSLICFFVIPITCFNRYTCLFFSGQLYMQYFVCNFVIGNIQLGIFRRCSYVFKLRIVHSTQKVLRNLKHGFNSCRKVLDFVVMSAACQTQLYCTLGVMLRELALTIFRLKLNLNYQILFVCQKQSEDGID